MNKEVNNPTVLFCRLPTY